MALDPNKPITGNEKIAHKKYGVRLKPFQRPVELDLFVEWYRSGVNTPPPVINPETPDIL